MQKRRQGAKPGAGREEVDAVGADMKNSQPVIWRPTKARLSSNSADTDGVIQSRGRFERPGGPSSAPEER
jgi:hypothetical protein